MKDKDPYTNTLAADDLVMQGARASADIVCSPGILDFSATGINPLGPGRCDCIIELVIFQTDIKDRYKE